MNLFLSDPCCICQDPTHPPVCIVHLTHIIHIEPSHTELVSPGECLRWKRQELALKWMWKPFRRFPLPSWHKEKLTGWTIMDFGGVWRKYFFLFRNREGSEPNKSISIYSWGWLLPRSLLYLNVFSLFVESQLTGKKQSLQKRKLKESDHKERNSGWWGKTIVFRAVMIHNLI